MIKDEMRTIRLSKDWIRILILILLCGSVCASAAIADEIPPEVRKALEKNADSLSPICVSWTQQLICDLPVDEFLKKVNDEAFRWDIFLPTKETYAWQNGMSYSYTKRTTANLNSGIVADPKTRQARSKPGVDFSKLPRSVSVHKVGWNDKIVFLFDGQEDDVGSLLIDSLDNGKIFPKDGYLFNTGYFNEAGFVLPSKIAMRQDGAKSGPLSLIEHGAKVAKVQETTLDGRACLFVELADKDQNTRFYLDTAYGFAVCRREETDPSGRLTQASTMSDFVQFHDPDIWLPKHCEVALYTWGSMPGAISKKPLAKQTFVVQELTKRPIPIERFSLASPKPDTYVMDSTASQAKQTPEGVVRYTVPEDPEELDAAIQAAVDQKPFLPKGLLVSKTKMPVTLASLAKDQQELVQAMAASASSFNSSAAHVRLAVFDSELPQTKPTRILEDLFNSQTACVRKVVTSADIRDGVLNHFDVILFPGGSGHQQAVALGDKGMKAVRKFVRDGGGYVGICAGSFLARSKDDLSLGIINAQATVSNHGGWIKMELTEVGKSILGEFPGLVTSLYGGGPIFSPAGEAGLPEYVPLAFYRTEVSTKTKDRTLVDTPSVIAAQYGKGRVLLFSVHPEGMNELESLVKRAVFSVAATDQLK
jgi:glutamine amidotransferase-like uncharacterized protein